MDKYLIFKNNDFDYSISLNEITHIYKTTEMFKLRKNKKIKRLSLRSKIKSWSENSSFYILLKNNICLAATQIYTAAEITALEIYQAPAILSKITGTNLFKSVLVYDNSVAFEIEVNNL